MEPFRFSRGYVRGNMEAHALSASDPERVNVRLYIVTPGMTSPARFKKSCLVSIHEVALYMENGSQCISTDRIRLWHLLYRFRR